MDLIAELDGFHSVTKAEFIPFASGGFGKNDGKRAKMSD
jgi:hypothetical protein